MKHKNSNLKLLIKNIYNAKWHKDFNPESFFLPNEDMTPITDDSQFDQLNMDELQGMARCLVAQNLHLMGTPFYNVYVFPIRQITTDLQSVL